MTVRLFAGLGSTAVGIAGASTMKMWHVLATEPSVINGDTLIPIGGWLAVAGGLFYAGAKFQKLIDKIDDHSKRLTEIENKGCAACVNFSKKSKEIR